MFSICQKSETCISFYWLIIQITLCLMKHLHYWIGLKSAIAKIRKGALFWKQPLDNTLFNMYLSSSASINKKICCLLNLLYYRWERLPTTWVTCPTLLAFGIGGSMTLSAYKMELFATNVNSWRLLLWLQRVPSYMWQES